MASARPQAPGAAPPPRSAEARAPVNRPPPPPSNPKLRRAEEAEEDRGLVTRAQAGDKLAFRLLVERHQRRAFAIAMSHTRNEADAREIVQDAFLRVYKSLDSFQGGSSFFTWLYRIIANLAIDLKRKPGRNVVDLEEGRYEADEAKEVDFPFLGRIDGADPSDVVKRKEISTRVQAALDALPSYHREVIVMREIEGLSYEEMAKAAAVSKGTIMSRLFHARQKMQRALVDVYAEHIGAVPASAASTERATKEEGES